MPDLSSRPLALRALTFAAVAGCAVLLYPVLTGVTWGAAFAVVAWPLHRRLLALFGSRTAAAVVSTTFVVLALVVPTGLVGLQLVREGRAVERAATEQVETGAWRERLAGVPQVGPWLLEQLDGTSPEQAARQAVGQLGGVLVPIAGGVGAFLFQSLVAGLTLFFAFRDGPQLTRQVERMLPLDQPTAERFTARAADAVNATLVGTIFVGLIQGVTGGLLFWAVGLPAAVLWGVVMFVASVLPVLGAFMVWVPAAAYLATQDEWGKAAALVAWGVVMAGPVGNLLYARLAGDRMGLHPLVSLLAFLGGLAVFGVAGMILGSVFVVLAAELLRLWVGTELTDVDSEPA